MLCGNNIRDYGFVAYLISKGKPVYLNKDNKSYTYLNNDLTSEYEYYKIHHKSIIDLIVQIKRKVHTKSPKT